MMNVADALDHQLSVITSMSYAIEIGVVSGHSKKRALIGITNAELMFIHENGSPLKNIPSRPVLDMTIAYAQKELLDTTLEKCLDGVLNSNWQVAQIENELEKMCLRMENYARDLIYSNDGRLTPNAPSTIERKGYNHPLFQTSQLARSITCRLVKI